MHRAVRAWCGDALRMHQHVAVPVDLVQLRSELLEGDHVLAEADTLGVAPERARRIHDQRVVEDVRDGRVVRPDRAPRLPGRDLNQQCFYLRPVLPRERCRRCGVVILGQQQPRPAQRRPVPRRRRTPHRRRA